MNTQVEKGSPPTYKNIKIYRKNALQKDEFTAKVSPEAINLSHEIKAEFGCFNSQILKKVALNSIFFSHVREKRINNSNGTLKTFGNYSNRPKRYQSTYGLMFDLHLEPLCYAASLEVIVFHKQIIYSGYRRIQFKGS